MPPLPSGETIEYGPNVVPGASVMRGADYIGLAEPPALSQQRLSGCVTTLRSYLAGEPLLSVRRDERRTMCHDLW